MGVVDKEHDAAALGSGVEQLRQAAQHHQRVLKVGGIEFVEKHAQGAVWELGGNGTAPDLDHQEIVTELFQCPLGDEGLSSPVFPDYYRPAAGSRGQRGYYVRDGLVPCVMLLVPPFPRALGG
ncbi:hypothetical protein NicSoilB4_10100 [Arthrobacter sp. NicSoilB4]|nr:hypothetical protein NicSoilB4_10100 [Arthrobacter sp. NicSoilB4]